MRKFLSIFMSLVMVVTMLPKVSSAEENVQTETTNEEKQSSEGSGSGTEGQKFEGIFKYLQGKFPSAWEKMESCVEDAKNWGKDYYNNVSEFAGKAGALGVAATIGLSALVVKLGWKVLKFIVWLFSDEDNKQAGYYNSKF